MLLVQFVAVAGNGTQGGPKAGRAVAGEADQAGLLVEGPADCLADPEGGVGRELEALPPIELVDRVFQTKVALLDQVQKLHAGGQWVAAGHAHHQAQVGPDEAVLGPVGGPDGTLDFATGLPGLLASSGVSPSFDDLGQFPFLLGVQEGNHADLVQVLAYGITHVLLISFSSLGGAHDARRCRSGISGKLICRLDRSSWRLQRLRMTHIQAQKAPAVKGLAG